jgi:hypothetical protein
MSDEIPTVGDLIAESITVPSPDQVLSRMRLNAAVQAATRLPRWRVVEVWRREYEVEAVNEQYARIVADEVALDRLDLTFEGYETITRIEEQP